jgi:AcrR family transcriptional regulator
METIRRRQVVEAVIKILETQGWKDLTIREVSEVAGVSAGIVTHYFGNKRTMTMDSLAEAHHRLEKALQDIERRRLAPLPRLLATVELIANPDATIPRASFWLALWGRLPFDRLIQAEMNKLRQRTREFLCDIFNHGLAQGVFVSKVPAADIAESVLALNDGLTVASVLDPSSTSPMRRKNLLLAFLRHELGSDLAGPPFSIVGSA